MRLLVIGLDGGDYKIIRRMPMPFLHSLLKKSGTTEIGVDLHSRGWVDIYTGLDATSHGGFYINPKLDGSHWFTMAYNHKHAKVCDSPPLWERANARGLKVGFMNIPTTSPAPKVDGFFVGGAGGGINSVEGVPRIMCDTSDTKALLDGAGYIPDLRIGPGGIDTAEQLFRQLDEVAKRRGEAFRQLCERHEPDLGFLAFRTTATAQYVAMHDISAVIRSHPGTEVIPEDSEHLSPVQRKVLSHFAVLDQVLRETFEQLSPSEWLFCSDHGMSEYRFNLNANAFLSAKGFLTFKTSVQKEVDTRVSGVLASLRYRKITAFDSLTSKFEPVPYNKAKTSAFTSWYCKGIFINDEKRFGGPVKEEDVESLTQDIIKQFNDDPEAKNSGLKASEFRRRHPSSKVYDQIPDIKIEMPATFFPLGEGPFIWKNPNFKPLPEVITGLTDMNSGQKGESALFLTSPGLQSFLPSSLNDLTLVNRTISSYIESLAPPSEV